MERIVGWLDILGRWWEAWSDDHPGCVAVLATFLVLWFLGWLLVLLVAIKIFTSDVNP